MEKKLKEILLELASKNLDDKDLRIIKTSKLLLRQFKIIKEDERLKSLNKVMTKLFIITEELKDLKYTITRDSNEIQVDGIILLDKLRDGWKVKSIDWSKLLEDEKI